MIISILVFILSIIPSVLIIKKLRDRKKDDMSYLKGCTETTKKGVISIFPIVGISALFALTLRILQMTVLTGVNTIFIKLIYTFVVLAFSEELVKYFMLKTVLKKKYNAFTWADVTAFMIIIGTTFGLVEDIPYAIGASPIVMLIRGFTIGHAGYGFVMGWFYGKGLYKNKKRYRIIAFAVPFVLHGIYDFSLSEEFLAINDNLAIVGLALAVLDIILLVFLIRFFKHSKNHDKYNVSLI